MSSATVIYYEELSDSEEYSSGVLLFLPVGIYEVTGYGGISVAH